ncbi:hypothetical protein QO002_001148 [Pararhizobium capsulatum DSM 1112]|uniref:Uncharacterized protein n=1 Tax=Pararhizobium capsulatum DSM 1112 TaxID=1121113 RepID=A0ABU0BNI8_9HYPH|nr:hypothetical protein [Pararhizobium capsulatum]MDQ0319010.1 hypothetical protein [Pararhizobium capsulatum DSM 1112]
MLRLVPTLAAILVLCGFSIVSSPAVAQDNPPIQVTSGIEYQFLERWDVDRLNQILKVDTPKFAGIPVSYSPASNAVRLYRVGPGYGSPDH